MTSCSVAKYIEVITNRHQILHIAIPKPICPDIKFPDFSANNLSFGTLWIQPDPKHIANTLESIIKMEHVPRAFIFSDGTSGIPELLLKNTNNHTADNEFDSPVFSPHAYQVQRGRLPSVYAHKPGIADLGQTLKKMGLNGTIATAVRHAYLFTVEPHVEVELSKIIKYQPKLNNFFWILGEGLDLPVNRIIHVLNKSGGEFMNLGFLSYNPLLSLEDSKDFLPDDPLIDGMRSMFNGDFQNLPVAYYENRDRLTFYSLEKPINESARFRATAHFSPGNPGKLTNFGKYLLDQTMISGLFANRFVNFHKRVLKLGVVMEEPLIMGGRVLENGQVVNATGMTIDLLEILMDKFNFKIASSLLGLGYWESKNNPSSADDPGFRYELYQPRDGQYGIKNGSWTGLMRDLIEQHIDLIASPVTVNKDRSQVVSVVGQFMDSGIGILMARSSADPPIHQMFQPFKYSVWLLLGGSFLLVASLAYATSRFSPKGGWTSREAGTMTLTSVAENMWSSIMSLLFKGQELYPLASSARTILLSFWTLVLVTHAFWQADMTAHLTRNEVKLPVNSLEDLSRQRKIRPVLIKGTASYQMFAIPGSNQIYRRIYQLSKGLAVTNHSEAISLLLNNPNLAVIADWNVLSYAATKHCDQLALVTGSMVTGHLGFATLPNQHFIDVVSKYLFLLKERGIIHRLRQKWWFTVDKCTIRDTKYRPITVQNSAAALITLCSFICLSLVVLLAEIFWSRMVRNNKKCTQNDALLS
ncbi:hypothetical protein P879_00546 [Paragonimus westermani]|uniref:Ionotropic glutamate receptor C-terminal domain-containing protein n=1 Tax=Paragonimus westermani TaxID=34504 RepID=A0A8T0DVU1_9TREM|nr:hypothetical protein P879_00546 [Paragonimus westermani]